jgi:hypothetical protein
MAIGTVQLIDLLCAFRTIVANKMEQEGVDRELLYLKIAREWMSVSKLRKFLSHISKETNVALWKQFCKYPSTRMRYLSDYFDAD